MLTIVVIISYTTFADVFLYLFVIWTVINIYNVIVLDILWFCQSPKFVFKGTEDMIGGNIKITGFILKTE